MPDSDPAQRAARLIERIARLMQAQARAGDLNPAQWEALRYLARANQFSRTPTAAAQFLAATKGTVSQTLIALERKGLIAKHASERDRRGAVLAVTAEGHALIDADSPTGELAAAIAALPPLHVSIITQTLMRVLGDLLARNDGGSFGVCATCRHYRLDAFPNRAEARHQCGLLEAPLSEADVDLICVEHEAP